MEESASTHTLPVPMRLHHAARITRDSDVTRRLVFDKYLHRPAGLVKADQ